MRPLSSRVSVFDTVSCTNAVGTPGCQGVEADLHDRVRPLALLLGQRNDGRVVLAQVLPHAGAHVPVVGHAEADVQLLRRGFQPQVLHSLVGLGVQLQSIAKRHAGTCRRTAGGR